MSIPTACHHCGSTNLEWEGANWRCRGCNQAGGSLGTCHNMIFIDHLESVGVGGGGGDIGYGGSSCRVCDEYLRKVQVWLLNPVGPEPINRCATVARFHHEETGIERHWREEAERNA